MDLTPNYGFGKPLVGENYDVTVFNTNFQAIDLAIKARQNEAAAALAAANEADDTADAVQANLNKIKARDFAVPAINNGSSHTMDVTFPTAYSSPPIVCVTPGSARLGVGMGAITNTKFTVTFDNWSGGNAAASTARYIATPETP